MSSFSACCPVSSTLSGDRMTISASPRSSTSAMPSLTPLPITSAAPIFPSPLHSVQPQRDGACSESVGVSRVACAQSTDSRTVIVGRVVLGGPLHPLVGSGTLTGERGCDADSGSGVDAERRSVAGGVPVRDQVTDEEFVSIGKRFGRGPTPRLEDRWEVLLAWVLKERSLGNSRRVGLANRIAPPEEPTLHDLGLVATGRAGDD
jgi:hypothetical protein